MNIPLCKPDIGGEEVEAVREVIGSGMLVYGKKCKEFEKKFAEFIGTKYAVAMNSCTSALQVAIEAHGLKGEIIVPSFTFTASINAIVLAGCKPIFADVDYETRNIDCKSVKRKITKNTVGIMPVHFGGQSCRMDEIIEMAEEHGLIIIEDSAETIGGIFKNKLTGSFGDVGCFSFFPTKNMTTGEGGMVTTDDKDVKNYISLRIAHGIKKDGFNRDCVFPSYNMRLTDIQGAIGIVQLKKLNNMNNCRRKNAEIYNDSIHNINNIEQPLEDKYCKHVYQMYTITVPREKRNRVVKYLNTCGIGASVHFDPPVHLQSFYKNISSNLTELRRTEKLSKEIITLPMFPNLKDTDIDYIVSKLRSIL